MKHHTGASAEADRAATPSEPSPEVVSGKAGIPCATPLNADAFAFIVLQREYREQMDRHAVLRSEAQLDRERLERTEADALTASERATSIMETLLKLEQPRDAEQVSA